MNVQLDHLVVAAVDLQEGVDFIQKELGVNIPFGGCHPKMGTHNHVMQLSNSAFLEVIAIDPDLSPPERPRWFGLDDPMIMKSLRESPQLLTWVVNCNNIDTVTKKADCSFGTPEPVSRGDLAWHFGLPADGRLLGGGFLPYLIQWHTEAHPAEGMADVGVDLISFEIYHPYPHWLKNILASISAEGLVTVFGIEKDQEASLKAVFSTPKGSKELYRGVL